MREFPSESIKQAKEIAEKYKRRSNSKKNIARDIYENKFLEIRYGFNEAIKSGNCGMYLHEITKETDCLTMGGVLYLVAREVGLNPEIYFASGLKDIDEGEDESKIGGGEHAFITAEIGKNKTYIIDPFQSVFGNTTFNKERNSIKVYDKEGNKLTTRKYASLEHLSQNEYIERLEEQRTGEGGRLALASTQKITNNNGYHTFVTFIPDKEKLKTSLHISRKLFAPDRDNQYLLIDLITKVNKKGEFDFNKGKFQFYNAETASWSEHTNPHSLLEISVQDTQKSWKIFESITRSQGRKTLKMINPMKLEYMLLSSGLNYDFTQKPNTQAEKAITQNSLTHLVNEVKSAQEESIEKFLSTQNKNEATLKNLLTAAEYTKAKDANRTKENPEGLVFPEKERLEFLKEGFESYEKMTWELCSQTINSTAIFYGLKKGTNYSASRKMTTIFNKLKEKVEYSHNMGRTYNSKFPLNFHIMADKTLFEKQNNNSKHNLSQNDLKNAARETLFNRLITTLPNKHALFLASYKKGLQKLLDTT